MNKIRLTNRKERLVLSDTLPYETPATFSNRGFYRFLLDSEITPKIKIIKNNKVQFIEWKSNNRGTDLAVSILFGLDINQANESTENHKESKINKSSIPFLYNISHKKSELRTLGIIHPKNQIIAIEFYEKYKDLIIYFCQKSNFSLRAPTKIAKSVYWKDTQRIKKDIEDSIEEESKEQDNLKTFFVYRKISNVYKFFESKDYHRCEKTYENMAQLDISKCFDSIYTHSVAWATHGKTATKNILSKLVDGGELIGSFPDNFDSLMQDLNHKETNGIIIGPEISRVFAEIILQAIDVNTLNSLESNKIIFGHDYEVFRYVDDYFIFFNKKSHYEKIIKALQMELKEYKLSLNSSKEKIYSKPIITETTIAKNKISKLLEEELAYNLEEIEHNSEGSNPSPEEKVFKGSINVRESYIITSFKSILKVSGADYGSVINYTLAIIESKIKTIIRKHKKSDGKITPSSDFVNALAAIIEFSFFISSVSQKVNTAIKLCRIIFIITSFSKQKTISINERDFLFDRIHKNIIIFMDKSKSDEVTQLETLYMLTALSELGKEYRLPEQTLAKYIGFETKEEKNYKTYHAERNMNHFVLSVSIFYMKNIYRYRTLKEQIENQIIEKITSCKQINKKSAEHTILFFDMIVCPYISDRTKRILFESFSIDDKDDQDNLKNISKFWFTKWTDFNFGEELDRKRSLEVY